MLLDTREPVDFAAAHLRGAINVGLQGRFAEWAGEVLDPGRDIVLVGDPTTALESRVRLARIGFDRVVGYLIEPGQLLIGRPDLVEASSRVTVVELAELIGVQADIQLVDVRNPGETVEGTLPAARAVPLAELVGSLDEFDPETPTVVYCAGGYRSLVASSVLRHAGFTDVSDLLGGYGAWAGRHGHKAARRHHLKTTSSGRRAIAVERLHELGQPAFVGGEHVVRQLPYLIERTHGGGEGVQGQGLADHLAVPLHVALDD